MNTTNVYAMGYRFVKRLNAHDHGDLDQNGVTGQFRGKGGTDTPIIMEEVKHLPQSLSGTIFRH